MRQLIGAIMVVVGEALLVIVGHFTHNTHLLVTCAIFAGFFVRDTAASLQHLWGCVRHRSLA